MGGLLFECSIEKMIKDDEKVDGDDSGGGCSSGGGDDGLLSFSPKTQTLPIPDKKKKILLNSKKSCKNTNTKIQTR